MSDDDLREKMRAALRENWQITITDALMPVVREALADAWDAGHAIGSELGQETFDRNPWREDT